MPQDNKDLSCYRSNIMRLNSARNELAQLQNNSEAYNNKYREFMSLLRNIREFEQGLLNAKTN